MLEVLGLFLFAYRQVFSDKVELLQVGVKTDAFAFHIHNF